MKEENIFLMPKSPCLADLRILSIFTTICLVPTPREQAGPTKKSDPANFVVCYRLAACPLWSSMGEAEKGH